MDATFWAFIALIFFLAVIAYFKVPAMINGALDSRAERIRGELDEARGLREEAQQLLAEYQRKRQDAEKEAESIVSAAKREAEQIVDEAREKTGDYVRRRTVLAEQKIARAEEEAVNEVRARAADLAVDAARKIIADKLDTRAGAALFSDSLSQVKTKLN